MTYIPTTAEAKLHLRVDGSTEDSLIATYIDAANDFVKNYLDRETVPNKSAIKSAMLLIVGDLYENRGNAPAQENPAVARLLYPYRRNIGV